MSHSRRLLPPSAVLLLALAAAGCEGDEIIAPPVTTEGTLTIDASTGWGFASIGDEQTVTVTDPGTSSAWDIGFNATNVMLNGGAAGPGDVRAVCLCQNAGATDEQVLAMTPESELGDFEAVTADDIPAAEAFTADALVPAVTGWYSGTGDAAVAADKVWLLRLNGGASFAKFRVLSLDGPTAAGPGSVTIQYAVQPSAEAAFGPTETATFATAEPVGLDLDAGAATGTADWDVRFDGYTIRLNGGVSGGGQAAAAASDQAFDAITTASTDPRAYKADTFSGVFGVSPWYRYNIQGDHRISPTFDVYLVRRDDAVYKVQLIGYYGPAGETRRITFRYARLGA